MGLFGDFFQGNNANKNTSNEEEHWQTLTSISQLERILADHPEKTVVLFKHSTRCGISRMVWNQVRMLSTKKTDDVDLYYLDLISYRAVSNAIAEKLNVPHQSPQLIVVQNNTVVYQDSHSSIDTEKIIPFF